MLTLPPYLQPRGKQNKTKIKNNKNTKQNNLDSTLGCGHTGETEAEFCPNHTGSREMALLSAQNWGSSHSQWLIS